jgi:hypothetical protein
MVTVFALTTSLMLTKTIAAHFSLGLIFIASASLRILAQQAPTADEQLLQRLPGRMAADRCQIQGVPGERGLDHEATRRGCSR